MFKFNKSWKIICVVIISFSMLTHVSKIYYEKKKRERCEDYCERVIEEEKVRAHELRSTMMMVYISDLETCITNSKCMADISPTETGEEYWERMKSERKPQWQ